MNTGERAAPQGLTQGDLALLCFRPEGLPWRMWELSDTCFVKYAPEIGFKIVFVF